MVLLARSKRMYANWLEAARKNVENHLGDICTGDDDESVIREATFVLAFDGAVDAGADPATANSIATDMSSG
jgi:hypothetical protein